MSFLKNLFNKPEAPITTYDQFWDWFQKHESKFFKVVKSNGDIDKDFFEKISPKLKELKEGLWYLTGMDDDNTAELVLTADGEVSNIVFIEELVAAAPAIKGWKFTALKPALDIRDVSIGMAGFEFAADKLQFYTNDNPGYPDEIDITVIHQDHTEENHQTIFNGVLIFLDNFLGELDFAVTIDRVIVTGPANAQQELIPITKLPDYLNWRQKEFVEKYEALGNDYPEEAFSVLEAELANGNLSLAVVNTNLLQWDKKASHPWMLVVTVQFEGRKEDGMPDQEMFELLNTIEEDLLAEIEQEEGIVYIGRQTESGEREVYLACKDFRRPSKIAYALQLKYSKRVPISYDLYKDKYWRSVEHFIPGIS
jgi:hypothetical protein